MEGGWPHSMGGIERIGGMYTDQCRALGVRAAPGWMLGAQVTEMMLPIR